MPPVCKYSPEYETPHAASQPDCTPLTSQAAALHDYRVAYPRAEASLQAAYYKGSSQQNCVPTSKTSKETVSLKSNDIHRKENPVTNPYETFCGKQRTLHQAAHSALMQKYRGRIKSTGGFRYVCQTTGVGIKIALLKFYMAMINIRAKSNLGRKGLLHPVSLPSREGRAETQRRN